MSSRLVLIIAAATLLLASSAATAKNVKVDICHQEGNGGYHVINVSEKAVPAHLAHGDWLVEEEVYDGIDNDCDGEVDEDLCPCYSRETLDSYWPNNAPTWPTLDGNYCEDESFDNGNYARYKLRASGYEFENHHHSAHMDVFTQVWGYGGQLDNFYCHFDAWYEDRADGEVSQPWDYTDYVSLYITAEEYDACDAILVEFLDDCDVVCVGVIAP